MMTVMLTQAPLPLLPAGAAERAPGVGVVTSADGGGVVWVRGLVTFCWDGGDEAGRRLAAVQLVQLNAAPQKEVAAAFGVYPVTVWRWDKALAAGGVAGLIGERKGPRGPWKLTPELAGKIRGLDARGLGLEAAAPQCGGSTGTVPKALGRIPARQDPRRPPARPPPQKPPPEQPPREKPP